MTSHTKAYGAAAQSAKAAASHILDVYSAICNEIQHRGEHHTRLTASRSVDTYLGYLEGDLGRIRAALQAARDNND